jgi:four helix bundle protein
MSDFQKLIVWQKAQAMALDVLAASKGIRGQDAASFRSQLVRAAFSVPANIAEGRSQDSERQFARFLKIALNSSTEVEYHLLTCRDIGELSHESATSLIHQAMEVRKMLYGLLSRIKESGAVVIK